MSDFPPNPEDGELWLPSYIIHEISMKCIRTTAIANPNQSAPRNNVVFPPHLIRNNNPQDSKPNYVEICFGSFGTNNQAEAAANNNNNKVAAPSSVSSFHKPLPPTATIFQGFEGKKSKAVVGTGTGVFHPRSMNVITKKSEEISGGTGFFLGCHL